MNPLKIAFLSFFQPKELENILRQKPVVRKRVLWMTIVLALIWNGILFTVLYNSDLEIPLTVLTIIFSIFYGLWLLVGLSSGGIFRRDNLLSFTVSTNFGIIVGLIVISASHLMASTRPRIASFASTAIVFLGVSLACLLIASLRGRTGGVKGAFWLASLVSALIVTLNISNANLLSSVFEAEDEASGQKSLVILIEKTRFFFKGVFLNRSASTHFYICPRLPDAEITLEEINIPYRLNEDPYNFSFDSLYGVERKVTEDSIIRLKKNKVNDEIIKELERIKNESLLTSNSRYFPREPHFAHSQSYLSRLNGFNGLRAETYLPVQAGKESLYIYPPPLGIFRSIYLGKGYGFRNYIIRPQYLRFEKYAQGWQLKFSNNDRDFDKINKLKPISIPISGNRVMSALLLDNDSLFVHTDKGLWAFNYNDGTPIWSSSGQGWFNNGLNLFISRPELIDNKLYGLTPSGYLYCLDASDGRHLFEPQPVFVDMVSAFPWKIIGVMGSYYTAVIMLSLCLGLYRVPAYAAESVLHSLCYFMIKVRRKNPHKVARLSPLFFDHISTLRLPFSRRFLRRLAELDQKLCAARVVYLFDKTHQVKLAARFFDEFHTQNKDYLFENIYQSLRTENRVLINSLARQLKKDSLFYDLVSSYQQLLEGKTQPAQLQQHAELLREFVDQEYKYARELYLTYETFNRFFGFEHLEEMASADEALSEILKLSYDELLQPQLAEIFNVIVEMANDLTNYDIVDNFRDKQYYLSEARIKLYEVSRQAQELHEPERAILLAIVENWQGVITTEAKSLRGPAELELSILNRSINGHDQWHPVLINIRNTGQSPAENVRVTMLENENILICDPQKIIPLLGTGEAAQLEFSLSAQGNPNELRCYFDTAFDDFQRKNKLRPFADIIRFSSQEHEFRRIPNPYVVGTPIQNEKIFFGRQPALNFAIDNLSSGEQNNAIIFFGQRRVGKSSLLYRLMESSANEEYIFALIDCQGFANADTAALLYRICQSLYSAASKKQIALERPELKKFKENTFIELDAYLDHVEQSLGQRKIALLFDEYEFLEYKVNDGSISPEIFNKLRNLLQHRNQSLAFIFVGTHRLTELTSDYWSFLFNTALYHEIGPLDEEGARALITEPVKGYLRYDELVLDKIVRVTGLHPYFIQVTCRLVVNFCNQHSKSYVTLTDVNEILKGAVEGSTAHVKYLFKDYSSKSEQEMLALLERVTDESKLSASVTEISRAAADNQFDYDQNQLRAILSNLKSKKLVREDGYQGDLFRFEYEFLRLWIKEHVRIQRGSITIA